MTACLRLKHLWFGLSLVIGLEAVALAAQPTRWQPVGISGGGGMFTPAISPADPNLMMLNCDMSAAYLSEDGGRNWRMINHAQLRSDTACRPAFHPTDANIIYASSGGRLKISRDRGKTFAPIGNLKDSLGGEIAINPAIPRSCWPARASGRCWFSRDAGETWARVPGPTGQVIAFHFDRTRAGPLDVRRDGPGHLAIRRRRANVVGEDPGPAVEGDSRFRRRFGRGGETSSMLYCSIRSKDENGVFRGGLYRSRDRGETWESAMGQGLNTETKKADEWAYGPISQYHQLLATDAKPLTVYAFNTSTGFHPPHSDTVYRSDDGGADLARDLLPGSAFQGIQRRAGLGNRFLRAMLQGRRDAFRRGHLQHRSQPRDPRAQRAAHHA